MITRLGLQSLQSQLKELEVELVRVSDERGRAAAEGDLSENSAYIFLGERAEVLRSQIDTLKAGTKETVITDPPAQNTSIAFGHQIKISFLPDNRQMILTLVGENDARLKPNWISIASPIGLALLGKNRGDTITFNNQQALVLEITSGDI